MVKILHVEDSDDDADLLEMALDQASPGWRSQVELRRARDFKEGLDAVRADRPHLIVLDLNLPGRTGLELLRKLKSDPATKRTPVLVLSTSKASQDIITSYMNCAAAYLVKPSTFAGLVDIMAAMKSFWVSVASLP